MVNKKDPFEILKFIVQAGNATLTEANESGVTSKVLDETSTLIYRDISIVAHCLYNKETRNELMFTLNMMDDFSVKQVVDFAKTITGLDKLEVL